ncbi:pyruvate kinase [Thiovibrio frasassiensis]|uniref:Pyruvate kinase n=1 Tax=Thiovibrio frasassiensis TaxID=2984131 RepID=A0A9X4MGZ2_9BACT|nr:pyruvate kinase [Thiovibrio frasassiensis]MDG4475690.1 pyruvate kinase [Thiovibrio frasassiensis]
MNPFFSKTKIVATLGPASFSTSVQRRLMAAGVDGFRLNLSHGDFEEHAAVIVSLRKISAETGHPVAIIVDLPGPKMRLGKIPKPITVRRGAKVRFLPEGVSRPGPGIFLPHEISGLAQGLRPGSIIFVGDGMMQFRVKAIQGEIVETEALVAGVVRSNKGVNLPGYNAPAGVLTEQDKRGIAFAVKHKADVICISFVGNADDMLAARALLPQSGNYCPCLLAKIERRQAVNHLDDILAEADAVMVARGDLGIELPIEEIPGLQKDIIHRANVAAKPVIVATQMMLSMVDNARPTRAEVTDVANAILDGADAIMFSEETAIGHDPVAVVRIAKKIARQTERRLVKSGGVALEVRAAIRSEDSIDDLISSATCDVLENRTVDLAVTPTATGTTARRIARLRPRPWIVAITDNPTARNILALSSGVFPLGVPSVALSDFELAKRIKDAGLLRPGTRRLVITSGSLLGVAGTTNSLKIIDVF